MSRLGKRAIIELPDQAAIGWIVGHAICIETVDVVLLDGRRFHNVLPRFYTCLDADAAFEKYADARQQYRAKHRPQWKGRAA